MPRSEIKYQSSISKATKLSTSAVQSQQELIEIQEQINLDYENKLKEVNDEAIKKLKMFEQEHQRKIVETQRVYMEKKEFERSQYMMEQSRVEKEEEQQRLRAQ